MVKTLTASAGRIRDVCLIPGWEDSLEERMATHSSILTWSEEPGGLQSIVLQRVGLTLAFMPRIQDFFFFAFTYHEGEYIQHKYNLPNLKKPLGHFGMGSSHTRIEKFNLI